ncbi:MAG TPA: TRIC cation channel family protein [Acetobacteraceae bacterium]|jgi:uncharacterized membrane protein YeiH|nr:TRIC cation channel family protein [Acetobacteraceae bacterium]
MVSASPLILGADLAGTFVFAAEGAIAAMAADLDLLGIMVLSFATALAGGILRDLLIGAAPPNAIRDWRYCVIAFAAGVMAFLLHSIFLRVPSAVVVTLDAAGLSLFAVAGTEKALAYAIHPIIAVLMGAITAAGGGAARDILLTHVPAVLRVDIYATAALAGGIVIVAGRFFGLSPRAASITGGAACFALRMGSVWLHWQLPHTAGP